MSAQPWSSVMMVMIFGWVELALLPKTLSSNCRPLELALSAVVRGLAEAGR
jgi:hypothetical protein